VRRGRLRRNLQARLEDDGGVERRGDGGEEARAEDEEARLVEAVPVDVRRELQLLGASSLLRRRVRRRRRRLPAIYGLSSMPARRRQRYGTPGYALVVRVSDGHRGYGHSGNPNSRLLRRLGFWVWAGGGGTEDAGAEQAVGSVWNGVGRGAL
jgi:transposase InsO family protein